MNSLVRRRAVVYDGHTMSGATRWIALTGALCLTAASARAFPLDLFAQAQARTTNGEPVPGHGLCTSGAFCDVNQDTAYLFNGAGNPTPPVTDGTVFFGILGGSTISRSAGTAGGSAAPEPGAMPLIAAGLALLGVSARRRPIRA